MKRINSPNNVDLRMMELALNPSCELLIHLTSAGLVQYKPQNIPAGRHRVRRKAACAGAAANQRHSMSDDARLRVLHVRKGIIIALLSRQTRS